jgi:hypothetical protein
MSETPCSRKIQTMLLQESIWGLEDKVNIMREDLAKHEVDLLHLKHTTEWILRKLGMTNSQNNSHNSTPPEK